MGFDSGRDASGLAALVVADSPGVNWQGRWLRVRGVPFPEFGPTGELFWRNPAQRDDARAALGRLREKGVKTCIFMRWPAAAWPSGGRKSVGGHLPLDLREAYARGLALGEAYAGRVDAWEIDNEPDIGFGPENAETYAAFFKAMALGLREGERRASPRPVERATFHKVVPPGYSGVGASGRPSPARVLMAPLALPPGPYLERLVASDLLAYTDGFSYHYYGYAEDFSGVYRQFEQALRDLAPVRRDEPSGAVARAQQHERVLRKELPVFISEFGYGSLGVAARNTVAGRVAQWRWFESVDAQVAALRIEGAMAFYLPPYLEAQLNEFGLTMKAVPGMPAEEGPNGDKARNRAWRAGGLTFAAGDFGHTQPAAWMEGIGQRFGESGATPALAYLLNPPRRVEDRSRSWVVGVGPASPVVLDLVAGEKMAPVKSFQGYLLLGEDGRKRTGSAELRIYNFSPRPVSGRLVWTGGVEVALAAGGGGEITLAPGERVSVVLRLAVAQEPWSKRPWAVTLEPSSPEVAAARFVSAVYPNGTGLPQPVLVDFAARPEVSLAAPYQSRATEEPELRSSGRWRFTEGVAVREGEGSWFFNINELPLTTQRPAIVELRLPTDFRQELAGGLLWFDFRSVAVGPTPARYAGLSSRPGGLMQVHVRTATGNLYDVWPRRALGPAWQTYAEGVDNFGMSSFGRSALPWRLRDHTAVALVFKFWPRALPTEVEIKGARILRLGN